MILKRGDMCTYNNAQNGRKVGAHFFIFKNTADLAQKAWAEITERIFPVFCIGCGVEGKFVCNVCLTEYAKTIRPIRVERKTMGSQKKFTYVALADYSDSNLLGKIIYALKYNFVEAMHAPIRELFWISVFGAQESDSAQLDFSEYNYIVPVPLHRRRFAERGFNQAEIIARALSEVVGIPVLGALVREKQTKQQARLGREDRLINVADAFRLSSKITAGSVEACKTGGAVCGASVKTVCGVADKTVDNVADSIAGKKIIIVDDVFTTGATMGECVNTILDAGAVSVCAITLARD